MAVTVRAARVGDEDALVRSTLGNAWETEGLKLDDAIVRRAVGKLLVDSSRGMAYVAEDDGNIVASLYMTYEWSDWHDAWYWWIQSLYVTPEHRGKGIYSHLYKFVQEEARRQGDVRALRLYVEKNNEVGLRAYRGHAMKETPYMVFEQTL